MIETRAETFWASAAVICERACSGGVFSVRTVPGCAGPGCPDSAAAAAGAADTAGFSVAADTAAAGAAVAAGCPDADIWTEWNAAIYFFLIPVKYPLM
ncbi:hypothetical protein [Treponema brennaborense]|uniref:hypothetical protein n=1 Tax=Treponema brennaborense TaxID=81028 RepID=UPI00031B1021|nr:hypothetical protein [Treponema brennaborense]